VAGILEGLREVIGGRILRPGAILAAAEHRRVMDRVEVRVAGGLILALNSESPELWFSRDGLLWDVAAIPYARTAKRTLAHDGNRLYTAADDRVVAVPLDHLLAKQPPQQQVIYPFLGEDTSAGEERHFQLPRVPTYALMEVSAGSTGRVNWSEWDRALGVEEVRGRYLSVHEWYAGSFSVARHVSRALFPLQKVVSETAITKLRVRVAAAPKPPISVADHPIAWRKTLTAAANISDYIVCEGWGKVVIFFRSNQGGTLEVKGYFVGYFDTYKAFDVTADTHHSFEFVPPDIDKGGFILRFAAAAYPAEYSCMVRLSNPV